MALKTTTAFAENWLLVTHSSQDEMLNPFVQYQHPNPANTSRENV